MRKVMLSLFAVSALAVGAATLIEPANAGFGTCTYRCICSVPHKCCTVNGVTSCKPAPDGPLQCTQGYEC
jgi:hypothetical protein